MAAAALQQLMDMPAEQLARIPAGKPPPGVTPNFANPPTIVPLIMGLNTAFLIIATGFLGLRVYMKTLIIHKWKLEDTLLVIAWVSSVLFYVAGVLSCYLGAMGKHKWDVYANTTFYPGWFYTFWITDALPLLPLGLAKVAILLQYWHLFSTKRGMKLAILAGIISVSVFYTAFTIVFIVFTSPWPGESVVDCIVSWHALYFAKFTPPLGVVDVIFDFYVLLLPIPAVMQLQLSPGKKFGVLLMFMTGGLACAASLVSVYYRYNLDLNDISWTVGYIYLWGQIEMWAGIIVACAPTVHMFWNRHSKLVWLSNIFKSSVSRLSGSIGSSRNSSGRGRSNRVSPAATAAAEKKKQQMQAAEDRRHMTRLSHSMDSTRASTFGAGTRHEHDFEDLELGQKITPPSDQILVEHSYTVSAGEKRDGKTHHANEDSDTDVEAQR